MPRLAATATSSPPHKLEQGLAQQLATAMVERERPELARITAVFENAGVRTRHLAKPVEWYLQPRRWAERNSAFVSIGLDLLEQAAAAAMDRAGIRAPELDGIVLVTSTGISTPSLDARLANRMGMRSDMIRLPLWGLGCAGGVAGLSRAADLATARPDGRFLCLALELCSLAFLRTKLDKKTIVAASLFGDGCAAALIEGDDVADESKPRWEASASFRWPHTEHIMGWDVLDEGLDVVFDPIIPSFVRDEIRAPVDGFLQGRNVDGFALHPGGAKVLDAFEDALGLDGAALDASRTILRDHGNMSSPTVLYVLDKMLRERAEPGRIMASALGPGFSSESALLVGAGTS